MLGFFAAVAMTVEGAQPGWWTSSGAIDSSATSEDDSVVVQGQLKQFTEKAVLYLNDNLTNGAGGTLNSMVAGWSNSYLTNGYTAAHPDPRDLYAMNVGQFKYIAGFVYDRLAANGYYGLTPGWLHTNASDFQLANIGQLKTVFNFDITTPPSAVANLTAYSPTNGSIQLAWTLPATNNANSLTLQQSTNGGITWTTVTTLTATNTSYEATGLDTNASYTYQVFGNNGGGTGTGTSAFPGTPTPPIPQPPTGLVGSSDWPSYGMNLRWTNSLGATSYLIERQDLLTGTWTTVGTSTTTPFRDAGYDGGYHYRVSAINSAGTSSPSSEYPISRYAVIDFGANITPRSINNHGDLVADSYLGLILWQNGAVAQLPMPPEPPWDPFERLAWFDIHVSDINDSGTIVGSVTWSSWGMPPFYQGFYWNGLDSGPTAVPKEHFFVSSPQCYQISNTNSLVGSAGSSNGRLFFHSSPSASPTYPWLPNATIDREFTFPEVIHIFDNTQEEVSGHTSRLEAANRAGSYVWTSDQFTTVDDELNFGGETVYHLLTRDGVISQLPFAWQVNSFTDTFPHTYVGETTPDTVGTLPIGIGHIYENGNDIALDGTLTGQPLPSASTRSKSFYE